MHQRWNSLRAPPQERLAVRERRGIGRRHEQPHRTRVNIRKGVWDRRGFGDFTTPTDLAADLRHAAGEKHADQRNAEEDDDNGL